MHIPNFTEVLQEEAAQPRVIKRLLLPSYVGINRSSYSRGVVLLGNGSPVTYSCIGASDSHSLPESPQPHEIIMGESLSESFCVSLSACCTEEGCHMVTKTFGISENE